MTTKTNQLVAMALIYQGYPEAKGDDPEYDLPKGWDFLPETERELLGLKEGFNTVIEKRVITNQFEILINEKEKKINVSFKGSTTDNFGNWGSDVVNAGASEFFKLADKAQEAFETLKNDGFYKDFHFSTAGHSLGGSMAQNFGVRNDIDVYVDNSLPIPKAVIDSDYFQSAGGYDQALEDYKNAEHTVYDIRKSNDVASQNAYKIHPATGDYLSRHHEGPTILPGNTIPTALKAAPFPAWGVMADDHSSHSLRVATYNLGIDDEGRFVIPKGADQLLEMGVSTSYALHVLADAPIASIEVVKGNQLTEKDHKYWEVERADGTHQQVEKSDVGYIKVTQTNLDESYFKTHFDPIKLNEGRGQNVLKLDHYDQAGSFIESTQRDLPKAQEVFEKHSPSGQARSIDRTDIEQPVQEHKSGIDWDKFNAEKSIEQGVEPEKAPEKPLDLEPQSIEQNSEMSDAERILGFTTGNPLLDNLMLARRDPDPEVFNNASRILAESPSSQAFLEEGRQQALMETQQALEMQKQQEAMERAAQSKGISR